MKGFLGDRAHTADAPEVRVHGGGAATTFAAALQDLIEGARSVQFWHNLAWNDVKARYRRTWLGEFWTAINLVVFVLAVGTVYGLLLDVQLRVGGIRDLRVQRARGTPGISGAHLLDRNAAAACVFNLSDLAS
jgi:hypothetical protein